MYLDFIACVTHPLSVDYWSDIGIYIAEEKLSDFTFDDWIRLENECANRDNSWLERCAEVLSEVEDPLAVDLLFHLLSKENAEVKIAVLDSINSLFSTDLISEKYIVELIEVLNNVETSSSVLNVMLESLRKKLKC